MRNTTCHQVTPLMTLPCCFERAGFRPPLDPHSSVSSSHRQLPLLREPDSNLEITETLASAPCAPAPNASFCWLAATGGTRPVWRQHKAPAGGAVKVGGGASWWQNGSAECHTPSPLLHRTRPTVNMAPAVAKCQNLMSQKVRFCVRQ